MDAPLLLAAAAALIAAFPAHAAETGFTRARYVMGTVLEIEVPDGPTDAARAAVTEALDEVDRLDRLLSTWKPDSAVSRLNRGEPVDCPPALVELVRLSLHWCSVTGGAFIPTAHPLIRAYGIEPGERTAPDQRMREAAVKLSSTALVELTAAGWVRLTTPGAGLNFGAIGKGYALDRAGAILRFRGVPAARLNFGGQILALGAPPGTTGWEVVIADPRDPTRPAGRLVVRDASVSTSASPAPGHIVDPRTGDLVVADHQVTVVAPNATAADALSTACLVLCPDAAELMLRRVPQARMIWTSPRAE